MPPLFLARKEWKQRHRTLERWEILWQERGAKVRVSSKTPLDWHCNNFMTNFVIQIAKALGLRLKAGVVWGVVGERVDGTWQKLWMSSASNQASNRKFSQPQYWFFLVTQLLQPNSQLAHPAQCIQGFTATGSFWAKLLQGLFRIIFNCLA